MAEFLCRRRPRKHQRTYRHQLWHGSHRGALCPLRCASGPRVSGWSRADRAALLHELGVARLQAEEVSAKKKRWSAGRPRPATIVPDGRDARRSIIVLEFRLRIQTSRNYALPAVAAIAFGASCLFWLCACDF